MTTRRTTGNQGRGRGWGEMPSSSDLARLVLCEAEFVYERQTGRTRTDRKTRAASDRGVAEHLRAQVAMETHHNRPRPRQVPPAAAEVPASASTRDRRCFIATAVYGPAALETEQLRAFRDQVLLPTPLGRLFVRTYYRLSPPLAAWLPHHPFAARAVRSGLDVLRRVVLKHGSTRGEADLPRLHPLSVGVGIGLAATLCAPGVRCEPLRSGLVFDIESDG